MYYSSFFCNTLIHINYIGVANAIKHTRAIDREAATTNRILTPFVSFDFSWYSSLPASISPPNIITTRKCVLCNVDFIHSRRILFLLPNSANGWAYYISVQAMKGAKAILSDCVCLFLFLFRCLCYCCCFCYLVVLLLLFCILLDVHAQWISVRCTTVCV